MKQTDLVIIGRGPAGLQAAIYTSKADIETVVIGKDIGMLESAQTIHTLLGSPTISGEDLLKSGAKQAAANGASIVSDEVVSVAQSQAGFRIDTPNESYDCKAILLATGAKRTVPRLKNLKPFLGKGIYQSIADVKEISNASRLGVVGCGAYAVYGVKQALAQSASVTMFTNTHQVDSEFDKRVIINHDRIEAVVGDQCLEGLSLSSGFVPLDGLVLALDSMTSTDFAHSLGLNHVDGKIIVDGDQKTSLDGVYAAGDCTPGIQQVAKAIGEGCKAGMNIAVYLRCIE